MSRVDSYEGNFGRPNEHSRPWVQNNEDKKHVSEKTIRKTISKRRQGVCLPADGYSHNSKMFYRPLFVYIQLYQKNQRSKLHNQLPVERVEKSNFVV